MKRSALNHPILLSLPSLVSPRSLLRGSDVLRAVYPERTCFLLSSLICAFHLVARSPRVSLTCLLVYRFRRRFFAWLSRFLCAAAFFRLFPHLRPPHPPLISLPLFPGARSIFRFFLRIAAFHVSFFSYALLLLRSSVLSPVCVAEGLRVSWVSCRFSACFVSLLVPWRGLQILCSRRTVCSALVRITPVLSVRIEFCSVFERLRSCVHFSG